MTARHLHPLSSYCMPGLPQLYEPCPDETGETRAGRGTRCLVRGHSPWLWAKTLPAMQETQETCVRSLGQEDPLKQELAACSSILAWEVSWIEVTGGYGARGHKRVRHD